MAAWLGTANSVAGRLARRLAGAQASLMLQIEDIRAYARLQLAVQQGMTRDQYIGAVRSYAVQIHGETDEVRMMADRTARHLWASRGKQ